MKLAWHFSKVNPRFKNREATQGEFFACDTELRALIREAVQNSLDARRPGLKGPVSIRIYVSGTEAALSPDAAKRYFKGGWDHFHAEGNGLRNAPDRSERCSFITYEDSGTTGLTGDVDQYHEVPGVRNPFYYFFRAEGQSNKLEAGRGRWGLGKFVFPRSSRIRSFFGLTVRYDDGKRLLVGQSILRSHHVEDKSYTPDGWFGQKPDKDEAACPVDDADFLNQFEEDFCLERGRDPGLSVVIPFCEENWSASAVIESVVQDYFYVIMHDELIVTVEDSESQTVLNSQTISGIVEQSPEPIRTTVSPLLQLSHWAAQQSPETIISLALPSGKSISRWNRKTIDPDVFSAMQNAFNSNEPLTVRVPVEVQHRQSSLRSTHFDILLKRYEGSQQKKPMFIRDGIIISDVRTRLIRDVYAIVAIEEPALTEFLGDAENPAHTEWHEESSHFKGKYLNGAATLRFVRNAVADLCQILSEAVDEEDPELLLDVFSVGTAVMEPGWPVEFAAMTSKGKDTDAERLRTLKLKPRPARSFRLARREGGFRLSGRPRPEERNQGIEILVAYDRRGGSPLRKYSITDFQLDDGRITIDADGADFDIVGPNRMVVYPTADRFEVIVTGFDNNRDLFLQARASKEPARKRSIREETFVD